MKRSSVVLLWISFLGAIGGSVFQVIGAFTLYQLLHRVFSANIPAADEQLPRAMNDSEIARQQMDFAGGTVVHVGLGAPFALLPVLAWFVVWIADRGALKEWLGRAATWSNLFYLLLGLAMTFWLERFGAA
jgi:hypothetical protein